MNVDHLKLFVRLAATNNISLAGKELGLSPAVSSSYINKLEESVGVRLVHRTTRKVSLSLEGVAFLPHAEDVLASIEAACASVGAHATNPRGTLRIAAPASFGRMHLVPALTEFMVAYPDLSLDLRLCDTIMDLVEGGYDVAIRNAELKDSTLIAKRLASDTRIVCASPSYIKKYGMPSTPGDLLTHQCLELAGMEHWSFEVDGDRTDLKVRGGLKMDNGEALRDACINGLGITVSSLWCVYEQIRNGQLIQLLPDYPIKSDTSIWAVYPSSRQLAPKVRAFIDFFADRFEGKPYWEYLGK
ncbi:LysR family transcriptional regulator [Enterovibrio coralii]|uniref:LysR family transcriptional regulator n=1 Tax=Enterovibrio coralii TaxID=294935 RepID=A0A135IDH9_9GAMM|nr:LysR family transcriptional regulator [Enterovibrio coralii]KXF83394.1 LysR family transcriptional regulator [Enterovibrio coralii]